MTGAENGPVTGRSHRSQAITVEVEGLDVPLAAWADLPLPSSIRIRTATGRTAWLTASRRRLQDAARAREAAFGPNEYEAALGAILAARATRADLDRWIARKLEAPDWRLTAIAAMANAVGLLDERGRVRGGEGGVLEGVTVARALAAAGCVAEAVVVEDVVIVESAQIGAQELAAQELASL